LARSSETSFWSSLVPGLAGGNHRLAVLPQFNFIARLSAFPLPANKKRRPG
jgi:hypothetical protein